jgi:hypothetical protein
MSFPLAYWSYGSCYSLGYSVFANNGKESFIYRIPIASISLSTLAGRQTSCLGKSKYDKIL